MKNLLAAALIAATTLVAATPAFAYSGVAEYETNYDEPDYFILRDGRDELHMRGTDRWCDKYGQGDSYADFRYIIGSGRRVSWSIVGRCSDWHGDFVKVCMYTRDGNPCSTFLDLGWR